VTPQQRHREEVIYLASLRLPRPVCELAHLGGCDERFPGDLESDHVLEQRWIKSHPRRAEVEAALGKTLDDLLADGRNGWLLCGHHNRLKAESKIRIVRAWLPPSVEEFAAETLMQGRLERHFVGPPLGAATPLQG
jgi:hypothetical protein